MNSVTSSSSSIFDRDVESMKKIHVGTNQQSYVKEPTTSTTENDDDEDEDEEIPKASNETRTSRNKTKQEEISFKIQEEDFSHHYQHSGKQKRGKDPFEGVLYDYLDHPEAAALAVLSPVSSSSNNKKSTWSNNKAASKVFTREVRNKCRHNFAVGHFNADLENILTVMADHDKEKTNANPTTVITTKIEDEETINDDDDDQQQLLQLHHMSVVTFSVVTIQEYPIQPGDNPGGHTGCPITIGWDPLSEPVTLDLDAYEEVRHFNRRLPHEMELVSAHRQDLLLRMGYSAHEILVATWEANKIRRNRYQTIASLKSTYSQERVETFRKKFHNLMTFGGAKREERKFLAPYKKTQKV
jgi:hypothetical protein